MFVEHVQNRPAPSLAQVHQAGIDKYRTENTT